MFGKKKEEKGFKKIDKIITGLMIGGVVASVFGVATKTNKGKKITNSFIEGGKKNAKIGVGIVGNLLAKIVGLIEKKGKK